MVSQSLTNRMSFIFTHLPKILIAKSIIKKIERQSLIIVFLINYNIRSNQYIIRIKSLLPNKLSQNEKAVKKLSPRLLIENILIECLLISAKSS